MRHPRRRTPTRSRRHERAGASDARSARRRCGGGRGPCPRSPRPGGTARGLATAALAAREWTLAGCTAFLRQLAGDHRRHIVALEVVATGGRLSYRMGMAKRHKDTVLAALSAHLPGVAAEVIDHDIVHAPDMLGSWPLSSAQRPLRTDRPDEIARSVTSALVSGGHASHRHPPVATGTETRACRVRRRRAPRSRWTTLGRSAPADRRRGMQVDAETQKALREKTGEPGFRCVCRIGVDCTEREAGAGRRHARAGGPARCRGARRAHQAYEGRSRRSSRRRVIHEHGRWPSISRS